MGMDGWGGYDWLFGCLRGPTWKAMYSYVYSRSELFDRARTSEDTENTVDIRQDGIIGVLALSDNSLLVNLKAKTTLLPLSLAPSHRVNNPISREWQHYRLKTLEH